MMSNTETFTSPGVTTQPIAIIGLSCRFPGAATPEAFWQLLCNGKDAITEIPRERWDTDALYDPNPSTPGKMYTRWGGFVDNVDQFDAHFFGISPREAGCMDPQQRLLLEVTWEALENAGLAPKRLAGSQTGVFIGISTDDYSRLQSRDHTIIDSYTGTGTAYSIAANRLSFSFDFRGPSLAVDTACSSSLAAVHLACQSLWHGESSLALAGGVNLILSPELTIAFSQARMMAPDGRCKSFDARANGYVRSEGIGVIVLKLLSDALASGDAIYAVIRGTAVNQDGHSNGLTVPSQAAQEAVLRAACQRAGVAPGDIDYVEAHGTGTSLGDPIEAQALGTVLAIGRAPDRPCILGSAKTNIGHTEAAAGIASLIKVAFALKHRIIPPNLHFQHPNPHIPFAELPLRVPQTLTPWPDKAGPALAGVSSFSFGGTNAHVLLQEAPASTGTLPPALPQSTRPMHLLCLSAKSATALQELARRFVTYGADHPAASLADVCYTANVGRSHHAQRLAITADSMAQMQEKLTTFLADQKCAGLWSGQAPGNQRPKIGFLCTGQGSQYYGMGRQLYETQPRFRQTVQHCADILAPHLEQPLLSVLFPPVGEDSPLHETAYTQPALFTLAYALGDLWQSWGIQPDVLLGHSVGEYVAACLAGAFSLEDGLRLIAERGRLMQALPKNGEMVVVLAEPERVAQILAPYAEHVALAAVNGPANTVISGAQAAVQAVLHALAAAGMRTQVLNVSHAFHSPLMEPMLAAFEQAAHQVSFQALRLPLVSNVTGQLLAPGTRLDAPYWRHHVRQPVQFAAGMQTLVAQECTHFLELGPKPVLLSMGKRCLPPETGTWLPSLQDGMDDWACLLASLGTLYVHGAEVDWEGFEHPYPHRKLALPTYPFERKRYWVRAPRAKASQKTSQSVPGHPLLGQRLRSVLSMVQFESLMNVHTLPYVHDHCIQGSVVLPGMAYVEMAMAAATEALGASASPMLTEVAFHQPLFVPEEQARAVQTVLFPTTTGETTFQVLSLPEAPDKQKALWTLHASGRLRLQQAQRPSTRAQRPTVTQLKARCPQEGAAPDLYQRLAQYGLQYGPMFQGITKIWQGEEEALGQVQLPETLLAEAEAYHVHPVLLDAAIQVLAVTLLNAEEQSAGKYTYLPVGLDSLRVYGRLQTPLWSHAVLQPRHALGVDMVAGNVSLLDEAGQLLAELQGLRLKRLGGSAQRATHKSLEEWLYQLTWQPQARLKLGERGDTPVSATPGSWLIFADSAGVGRGVATLLKARGETVALISPGEEYAIGGPGHFRVNPTSLEDLQTLLQDAIPPHLPPCRGMVHLWSLDATAADDTTEDVLQVAQERGYGHVLLLVQALAKLPWAPGAGVYLVTRGAQAVGAESAAVSVVQAPLWGLGRVIALEYPELKCVRLDLDVAGDITEVESLFLELWEPNHEDQVAFRQTGRYVPRLLPCTPEAPSASPAEAGEAEVTLTLPRSAALSLETIKPGRLDNLRLQPTARPRPGAGQIEIQVYATGLNFRDVMNAMGVYPGNPIPFGAECAGVITALGEEVEGWHIGDAVVAVAPRSFSTFAITDAHLVVPKPPQLSFAEAATIPIVFLTAHYALNHLARMAPGERVLIHAAAGGVGLAAVQLAQRAGAEIFATAGSPEKRSFLQYIGVQHVMDSRSLAFADEVMRLTRGEGVDIVLNSLAGEYIPKSLSTLRPYGRFLEIGKTDIYQNRPLDLYPFHNNLSYFAIDLDRVSRDRPVLTRALFLELMDCFNEGTLRPLPRTVYPIQEVVSAFRYMAQRKNIGKVVVSLEEVHDGAETVAPGLLRADGTYLITGGLGALGLRVAQWLVQNGARHVVLVGRSAASSAQRRAVQALEQAGAQVVVVQADVSVTERMQAVLAEIHTAMPPLRGVIHAAGVLDDGLLINLDSERLAKVMAPKAQGAWNLHTLTRDLPLDFFVLFSSVVSVLGSLGQGSYAAANAFLDALAYHRRAAGLPALSINWGPWAEAGMAVRLDQGRRLALRGFEFIAPEQGLQALEHVLRQDRTQVVVVSTNWPLLLQGFKGERPPALLAALGQEPTNGTSNTVPQLAEAQLMPGTLLGLDVQERQARLIAYMQEQLAQIIDVEPAQLDPKASLRELGIDSLMAMELKESIESSFGVVLPLQSFTEDPHLMGLVAQVLAHLETSVPQVATTSA